MGWAIKRKNVYVLGELIADRLLFRGASVANRWKWTHTQPNYMHWALSGNNCLCLFSPSPEHHSCQTAAAKALTYSLITNY